MEVQNKSKIIKTTRKKEPVSESTLEKRLDSGFQQNTDLEELIKKQGVKPIKDDKDFDKIFGAYKEWFDVDDFLKEAHKPWKKNG
jgi:hypothetical protein